MHQTLWIAIDLMEIMAMNDFRTSVHVESFEIGASLFCLIKISHFIACASMSELMVRNLFLCEVAFFKLNTQ